MDRNALKRHLEFCQELGVRELVLPARVSLKTLGEPGQGARATSEGAFPSGQGASTRVSTPQAESLRHGIVVSAEPDLVVRRGPGGPPHESVAPSLAVGTPTGASRTPASTSGAPASTSGASASATGNSTMLNLPGVAPDDDSLDKIWADIGDCRRCRLCERRNKIVFGVGNREAPLVFVGEGPGADEDEQGIPFVGRAGQLLTQMIEGTAAKEGIPLRRADVYICNVVKCRPPETAHREPDEMEICGQFLFRQLLAIRPKAICALGGTAAKALLGGKKAYEDAGQLAEWSDIPSCRPITLRSCCGRTPERQARELGRPEEGAPLRV